MRDFLKKFFYLLDREDCKNFVRFLFLLFIGGFVSLLGIGAVIPFVGVLIDPSHMQKLPIINHFNYLNGVSFCVAALIVAFWLKNGAAFVILKNQSYFLNMLIAKIQKNLFSCYIYSPYIYHIKRSSAELVNNINVEVNVLSDSVITQLGSLLNEAVTSGMVFVALLFISPIFSLVIIGFMLLTAQFFLARLKHKVRYYSQIRATNSVGLTQSVLQGLSGIKETKVYQKEPFFVDKVVNYAGGVAEASVFASIFQQSSRFLIEAVAVTVVLLLMLTFLFLGYSGQKLLVLVSVFGVAAVQLLPSMNRLMQALANIKYGYVALNNVYNELCQYDNFKQSIKEQQEGGARLNPIKFENAIELKNICFDYGGDLVLNDIILTIPRGKKVALVGHSGAGKTTLVDIILGVLLPAKGEMLVDNIKICDSNLLHWQRHFGYIPQLIYIYNCSLRENIAFGLDAKDINDNMVWQVLEQASLSDFVKKQCPNGLDTLVGENGIRLSGGQRQRIGIARALFNNPDILVMDEATAALDNQTEHEITQALSAMQKNRTLITIAHRLTTIKNYDLIYVMNKGKIVSAGIYGTLLETCNEFKAMVNVSGKEKGVLK